MTRRCRTIGDAIISTTSPRLFDGAALDAYDRLERETKLARYGCDCYAYCMLAAGHIDIVVETGLKPHDIVALIPIIEGAGGVVTAWDGGPAGNGGSIAAAGDRRVHEAVLGLLNA
jgi:myo-inositol-1(or 4)-monophosphatase